MSKVSLLTNNFHILYLLLFVFQTKHGQKTYTQKWSNSLLYVCIVCFYHSKYTNFVFLEKTYKIPHKIPPWILQYYKEFFFYEF